MTKDEIMTNIINVGAIILAITEWILPVLTLITLIFAVGWNIVKLVEWYHSDWPDFKQKLNKKRDSK